MRSWMAGHQIRKQPQGSGLLIAPSVWHSLVLGERRNMDINPILTDLKAELNRTNQAIAAIEALGGNITVAAYLPT